VNAMDYETIAQIAQQGGSIYFVLIFAAGFAYAFWPKNRDTFARAKRAPLDDGGDDV